MKAETVQKKQTETLIKRLVKVKAEPLVDSLADRVAELDVKTLNNTLLEVKAEELVPALADKLAKVQADTKRHTGRSKSQAPSRCSG